MLKHEFYICLHEFVKMIKTKAHLRLFQGTLGNSKEIIYWIETTFIRSVIKFQELGTHHEHRLTDSSVFILIYITEYNDITIKSE